MGVVFTDHSVEIQEQMTAAAEAFLYEAASEVQSAAMRNSRVDQGQLKGSWEYRIDADKAVIGSALENAIWEEYGTGEHAVSGKGRKGGWLIPGDKLTPKAKSLMKKYTANVHRKKLKYIFRKNVDEFYFTYGKKPNHTLQKAIDACKARIAARAKELFGDALS